MCVARASPSRLGVMMVEVLGVRRALCARSSGGGDAVRSCDAGANAFRYILTAPSFDVGAPVRRVLR